MQRHLVNCHSKAGITKASVEEEPTSTNSLADFVTGRLYAAEADSKLKRRQAVTCPWPLHFRSADLQLPTTEVTSCRYVFSRAYDLSRHLQAVHGVEIPKDAVVDWVLQMKGQC